MRLSELHTHPEEALCGALQQSRKRKLLSIIKAHLHPLFHYFDGSPGLPRLPTGALMGFNQVT